MLETNLLNDINIVLSYFENSNSDDIGSTIYKRYSMLKDKLQTDSLISNPINGSVRAYLDAYNDWDNPILTTMGNLETRVDLIVKKENRK